MLSKWFPSTYCHLFSPWVPCWNRIFQRLGSCWIQGFRQQSFKLPGGVEFQWLQIYIIPLSPRKFQIKLNSVYIYIDIYTHYNVDIYIYARYINIPKCRKFHHANINKLRIIYTIKM